MKFCKLDSIEQLLAINMERAIIDYVVSLKESKLSHSTIHVLLAPIYHFCAMSEIVINRRKIDKYKPERKRVVKDRAYTHEEIAKLLNVADLRMKAIILLMVSGGLRVGAIPSLKLRDLQKLDNVDIYKIIVYENSTDEYYCFCSPECSKAIDDYLEFRKTYGEDLNPESYLIIREFNINSKNPIKPKPITVDTTRVLINMVTKKAGLRQTNHSGTTRERKSVMLTHNFRKFYTTQAIKSGVKPEIREMCLGHTIGLADSYYRPTENEILAEYSKMIDSVTIDPSNRLKREIKILSEREKQFLRYEEQIKALEEKQARQEKLEAEMKNETSILKKKWHELSKLGKEREK